MGDCVSGQNRVVEEWPIIQELQWVKGLSPVTMPRDLRF